MFGLSFGEIVIIAVIALLLLGPDRLPDAAKTLGKTMREIRKATEDLKDQVEKEIYADEKKPALSRPSLVPPVPTAPIPGPSGPPPAASSENVPGLEAALAEGPPEPQPELAAGTGSFLVEPPPEPEPEPAAAGQASGIPPDAGKVS